MKNQARQRRGAGARGGFTLLELMVALVVLTIGLFAIVHLQVVTIRGHSYAWERTEAFMIGEGVIMDLRSRGLEWEDLRTLPDRPFADVFDDIHRMGSTPQGGDNIGIDQIRALNSYTRINVSTGDMPDGALPINVFGLNAVGNPGLEGARSSYRILYVSHDVPQDGIPGKGILANFNDRMTRVTVYVGWDNKDHGSQDIGWGNWWDAGNNFWQRHVVPVTSYMRMRRKF